MRWRPLCFILHEYSQLLSSTNSSRMFIASHDIRVSPSNVRIRLFPAKRIANCEFTAIVFSSFLEFISVISSSWYLLIEFVSLLDYQIESRYFVLRVHQSADYRYFVLRVHRSGQSPLFVKARWSWQMKSCSWPVLSLWFMFFFWLHMVCGFQFLAESDLFGIAVVHDHSLRMAEIENIFRSCWTHSDDQIRDSPSQIDI
jgi:hypothetical protein